MKKPARITVIDNEDMRGVLAPSAVLSKKMLADMIDFIELSSEKSNKESTSLIQDADAKDSWLTFDDVRKASDEAD